MNDKNREIKKRMGMKNRALYKLVLILSIGCFTNHLNALVSWNNTTVTTDVTDDNLDIRGTNMLSGGIHVSALTKDILITVQNGDSVVRGTPTGPSRLYLFADTGRTITACLQDTLTFLGSSGGTDLLITVTGPGDVEFFIQGDEKVVFTSNPGEGGVEFYVAAIPGPAGNQQPPFPGIPKLHFNRFPCNGVLDLPKKHVEVVIGPKSFLSFFGANIISIFGQSGIIFFDPTNNDKGRMVLRIQDTGAFILDTVLYTPADPNNIMISDINRAQRPLEAFTFTQIINNNFAQNTNASLLVINENNTLGDIRADPWFTGIYNGIRYGFVLDVGQLQILSNAYLDYVGTSLNQCPKPNIPEEILEGRSVSSVVKVRNPSALVMDVFGTVACQQPSALFLRSGVDDDGNVLEKVVDSDGDLVFSFTIDPEERTPGAGNIVLVAEGDGTIDSVGDTQDLINAKMEVLSLHVTPTGGSVLINTAETIFPTRDFAVNEDGDLARYNKGCCLINTTDKYGFTIRQVALVHSDVNHQVFEEDDIHSEPTYIGGDTWKIAQPNLNRPTINFNRALLFVHSDIASTGVDFLIPERDGNHTSGGNCTEFTFFYNGRVIDDGTGRHMVLGTNVGSHACDGCSIIDNNAHLDLIQKGFLHGFLSRPIGDEAETIKRTSAVNMNRICPVGAGAQNQQLNLLTLPNNNTITQGITGDITDQFSVQTIYLGHKSNISVGADKNSPIVPPDPFFGPSLEAQPNLIIDGNYFAFETRGGRAHSPKLSTITGEGGTFVDLHGTISITPTRRASMGTMVTKSRDAVIDLPKNQVLFKDQVGISQWLLNLNDPFQRVIVDFGQNLSDYTLNWRNVTKDFSVFTPYEIGSFDPFSCPPVTAANITAIPTVFGSVDQLQILGSRLGDQAHVLVGCGGTVGELVFLKSCDAGQAPVGVVVLQNEGTIGLGSANRNTDSVESEIVLGVNGVTLIANGDGHVELNQDLIINNVCHILAGPDFGSETQQSLEFDADCCRTIYVKNGGVLDLSSFTTTNQVVELSGQTRLVLEPGAQVVMGGGILQLNDDAAIIADPEEQCQLLKIFGPSVTDTDAQRVKLIGTGTIIFNDKSSFVINNNSYVGVETFASYTQTTSLSLVVHDNAKIEVGQADGTLGGTFQVGNTVPNKTPSTICLSIVLDGPEASFNIGSQGFVGLGVGVAFKDGAPNNWLIDTLSNVASVTLDLQQGNFAHNRVYDGNSEQGSLFAVGPDSSYVLLIDNANGINGFNSRIMGGGNFIAFLAGVGPISPSVTNINGVVNPRITVGLLSSTQIVLPDNGQPVNPMTQAQLFSYWSMPEYTAQPADFKRATAGRNETGDVNIGYIDCGFIQRITTSHIVRTDGTGALAEPDLSERRSAVQLSLMGSGCPRSPFGVFEYLIPA